MAYKDGDENVPLRGAPNKDLPMLVLMYDLKTDELVKEIKLNYGDFYDRKHLGRLTFWALSNHCSIETVAMVDADLQKEGE